jgi:hypothetical protein
MGFVTQAISIIDIAKQRNVLCTGKCACNLVPVVQYIQVRTTNLLLREEEYHRYLGLPVLTNCPKRNINENTGTGSDVGTVQVQSVQSSRV